MRGKLMTLFKIALCVLLLGILTLPASGFAQDAPADSVDQGRNVARDFGGGIVDLGQDALDFITAPFHLDRRGAIKLTSVIAIGGVIFIFDQEIHDYILRTQDQNPWKQILEVGEFLEPLGLMDNTNPYWFAGMTVGYVFKFDGMTRMFQQLLFSHLVTGATMVPTRYVIGRYRPRDDRGPYVFEVGEGTSFPSGHTSTVFSLAKVLSNTIGWWPASAVLYGLAGTVAYQRMAGVYDEQTGALLTDSAHWPSDVWIGMWWGLTVTNIVIGNSEARANPRIQTGMNPATGEMTLNLLYRF